MKINISVLFIIVLFSACSTINKNNTDNYSFIVEYYNKKIPEEISTNSNKIFVKPILPVEEIKERLIYPEKAQEDGIEQVVNIEIYINTNGRIVKIKILNNAKKVFVIAVLNAFNDVVCIPAKDKDGENISCKFRYPIKFVLKK